MQLIRFLQSFVRASDHALQVTEGGFFEARVGFYIFLEIFGFILINFYGFRAILMVLAVWARSFMSEWYRNHPKIWSGG